MSWYYLIYLFVIKHYYILLLDLFVNLLIYQFLNMSLFECLLTCLFLDVCLFIC